jgi:methylmalonyl-CoA/ethylmalonyl-CoA epimerase
MTGNSQAVAQWGPIMQLAYVAVDFESTLRFWTEQMGVGPFFRFDHVPFSGSKYRDKDCRIDISSAFAYWGDTQIELIHQHDEADSVFKAWSDSKSTGVHHVCVLVSDIEAVRERCVIAGATVEQEAWMEGAGHFIYVDFRGGQGLIEFAQLAPAFNELFSYMRRASQNWDGLDPVRPIPPPEQWRL